MRVTSEPIAKHAVAAGEGALSICMLLSLYSNLKSSISDFRKTYLCDYSERIDDIISEI